MKSFRRPAALLAEEGEDLPFDTSVMRTIFYVHNNLKSGAAAREKLIAHMKSALEGAVDSPISTAVDLASLRAGNPTQRQLAEIVRSLERLGLENQEIKRLVAQDDRRRPYLPPVARTNLEEAHRRLQAQLDDDPPPFELEHVANLIASVAAVLPPRPAGRPRPTVRLDESDLDKLRRLSAATQRSTTDVLREMVSDYLQRKSDALQELRLHQIVVEPPGGAERDETEGGASDAPGQGQKLPSDE